jgi:hypothetical protein
MSPSPLPVPNSTISFWRSTPSSLDDYRSTPDVPAEVDIAVVGAGFAGISTVYHVLSICKARGMSTPRIVILEARQACSGATGRNGTLCHLKSRAVDPKPKCAHLQAAISSQTHTTGPRVSPLLTGQMSLPSALRLRREIFLQSKKP